MSRRREIVNNLLVEASDRVWLDRSNFENPEMRDLQQEIIDRWDIDLSECDDFYHGYWSGILAACKLIAFPKLFSIEDVAYMNTAIGILDT